MRLRGVAGRTRLLLFPQASLRNYLRAVLAIQHGRPRGSIPVWAAAGGGRVKKSTSANSAEPSLREGLLVESEATGRSALSTWVHVFSYIISYHIKLVRPGWCWRCDVNFLPYFRSMIYVYMICMYVPGVYMRLPLFNSFSHQARTGMYVTQDTTRDPLGHRLSTLKLGFSLYMIGYRMLRKITHPLDERLLKLKICVSRLIDAQMGHDHRLWKDRKIMTWLMDRTKPFRVYIGVSYIGKYWHPPLHDVVEKLGFETLSRRSRVVTCSARGRRLKIALNTVSAPTTSCCRNYPAAVVRELITSVVQPLHLRWYIQQQYFECDVHVNTIFWGCVFLRSFFGGVWRSCWCWKIIH